MFRREKSPHGAKYAVGVLVASLLACAPFTRADTVTTTFNVTATVVTACTVSASNLAFGNYDPTSVTPTDGTSTVTARCTSGTTYHVRLGQGLYGTGVTDRKMQRSGETNTLNYVLYSDSSRSVNWGETDGVDTVDGTGTGAAVGHTVYGRVAALQAVPAGSYSDTVIVTVSY